MNKNADKPCFTCDIVSEYVDLASRFTQDMSELLLGPMWALYLALVGLWVVIQGIRLVLVHIGPMDVAKEFMFVMIAGFLLSGQGPELVNSIYTASLDIMGGASGVALTVGGQEKQAVRAVGGAVPFNAGMVALVKAAEEGLRNVFGFGESIMARGAPLDPMPWLYGLVLVIPYFIIIVLYLAQVVISIFRVMMLATFSPFLMLGFGFGWGRDMMKSGIKTLISSFMVLFGATAAVAVMLYAVRAMDIGGIPDERISDIASITNEKFLLTMVMGWMGSAFLFEATGLANSITQSALTNTGAMAMTAGVSTSVGFLMKNPASKYLGASAMGAVGTGTGFAASKLAQGAGYTAGAAGHYVSPAVEDIVNKAKDYQGYKDGKYKT